LDGVVAVPAAGFFALCFFTFLVLVVVAVLLLVVPLLAAGAEFDWPANAKGVMATAIAIARKLFFMVRFSMRAFTGFES
jgi:hypothetical protein